MTNTPQSDTQAAVPIPDDAYAYGGTDRDYVKTSAVPGIVAAELERLLFLFQARAEQYPYDGYYDAMSEASLVVQRRMEQLRGDA